MSYAGTVCPCGEKKPGGTMLCPGCENAFAEHPSMAAFKDTSIDRELRQHAAMTLLTLARGRKKA